MAVWNAQEDIWLDIANQRLFEVFRERERAAMWKAAAFALAVLWAAREIIQ